MISDLIKSLAMTSCSFFWGEFLHLAILSTSLCVCVCMSFKKQCYISAPESNGYIKKVFYTILCLVSKEMFQSVHSAVVFFLFLPLA